MLNTVCVVGQQLLPGRGASERWGWNSNSGNLTTESVLLIPTRSCVLGYKQVGGWRGGRWTDGYTVGECLDGWEMDRQM